MLLPYSTTRRSLEPMTGPFTVEALTRLLQRYYPPGLWTHDPAAWPMRCSSPPSPGWLPARGLTLQVKRAWLISS